MPSPPTGTVTFLFTDIEGSTKMWERERTTMSEALALHDRILRDAVEERGGYVFKTVGDAFCCAFPTTPDALEAALEAQRTLLSSEWQETGPLRVRMALHMGVAEERDGDYFGPPVNRVARLLSAGHGGQVLLSLPTQELVRDHLPPLELMLGGWRRVHINGTVGLNGVEARYQSISWTAGDSRGLLETYSSSFNYLSHPKSTYIASAIEGAYAQSAIGPSSREGEVGMPTITVEKSVTIDRPADQVWRFLSDENSAIKWQQSLHSHRKEGNSAHQVRKFGGHRMEMHHKVQNDHGAGF